MNYYERLEKVFTNYKKQGGKKGLLDFISLMESVDFIKLEEEEPNGKREETV